MDLVSILLWIILGAVAGWLAGVITNSPGGLVKNIIVGIVGAFLGGVLMNTVFGQPGVTGINIWSLVVAVIGAIVLLLIVNAVSGRKV